MKLFKIFLFTLIAVGITACDKQLEEPVFDVLVKNESTTTTEAIHFSLLGNVEMLTFYSGEPGSEYVKRNGVDLISEEVITPDKPMTILKSYSQPFPSEFKYLYEKAGVYIATFVGKNLYKDSENVLVKECVIIIK